ncbi:hypothetical protein [Photobacterium leiognathi]|nr:hypothetical protein [Photobacterium leiognathi]
MHTQSAMIFVTCFYGCNITAQYAMCADNTRQLLMLSLKRI